MSLSCRIAGCRRKPHAHGLCQRHYDQQRKARSRPGGSRDRRPAGSGAAGARTEKAAAAVPAPPLDLTDKLCSVAGCTSPHHAKGYCKSHYGQLRRRGRIEELPGAAGGKVPQLSKERRLVEIMKRHELLKKEIASIHKELESEANDD